MTLKAQIRDGTGTAHLATVSHANELIIDGFPGATPIFKTINVINTAFNFFIPISGQNFVITSIIFDVGAASVIDVYEASSATSIVIDKQIFQFSLLKDTFVPLILPFGGFIKVTEGEFLNAKVSVQPVGMTIIGFYKPITVST